MADLHKLSNRPRLARLTAVEPLVAASLDGADARQDAIDRLGKLDDRLLADNAVIAALDYRRLLRPPVPTHTTTQTLVRAGRRRIDQERVAGRRTWHDVRKVALDHLRGILLT